MINKIKKIIKQLIFKKKPKNKKIKLYKLLNKQPNKT